MQQVSSSMFPSYVLLGVVCAVSVFPPSVRAQTFQTCNCACCIVQSRGEGSTNWGREAGDGNLWGCGPIYYSQHFMHEGFASCDTLLGKSGNYCERQRTDPVLASSRDGQVDIARFCFYECMPSAPLEDAVMGGECVPATAEALKAVGAMKTNNPKSGQTDLVNDKPVANKVGNGVDLAKGDFGTKLLQTTKGARRRNLLDLRRRQP